MTTPNYDPDFPSEFRVYRMKGVPSASEFLVEVIQDETIVTVATLSTLEAAIKWGHHFVNTGVELPDSFDTAH